MLLTVDELNQIYSLLQEYPDATDVSVYSEFNDYTSFLVVDFNLNEETLGTIRIGDK